MREPLLVEASDETLHAFPSGTPETEIERYMWRYENGQDLPDWAFSDEYENARCSCRQDVYIPPPREQVEGTAQKDDRLTPVRFEGFENPGAVFDSREAAAYDIMSRINPHSREINKEFSWMYYTDPTTGKFGYSDPYESGEKGGQRYGLGFSVNGTTPLASDRSSLTSAHTFGMGHTHGDGYGHEDFSHRNPNSDRYGRRDKGEYDVEFMKKGGATGKWNYFTLGTPSGTFLEWTPESRRQRLRRP